MKQKLEIKAISMENVYKRNHQKQNLPEKITLNKFDEENVINNQEKISKILEKCDKNGSVINNGSDEVLMPILSPGESKEYFTVNMILYTCSDWNRFEKYTIKEGNSENVGVAFDQYVMSFSQFESFGRPKEIFIDYHKAISLKEN